MKRLALCAALLLVISADAPRPTMRCRPEGRYFVCTASNFGELLPHWKVRRKDLSVVYSLYGDSVTYPASRREWLLIECRVEADEGVYVLRGWTKIHKDHAMFVEWREGVVPR